MVQLKSNVGNKLVSQVNRIMLRNLEHQPKLLQQALGPLLNTPGKMIRPWLLLNCYAAFGGRPESALDLAASLEFLHLASIIHDDLIDNATIRRGNATIQLNWDHSTSILAGDFCFGQSLSLASPYGKKYVASIGNLVSFLVKGEMLQKEQSFDATRTERQYWECIYYKTAVFFQQACLLGATAAQAPEQSVAGLYRYGTFLGLAYQLKDDLLDFASEKRTLKDELQDLKAGIYTLPVIHALCLGVDPSVFLSTDARSAIVRLLEASGSFQYAMDALETLSCKSQASLIVLSNSKAKEELYKIAMLLADLDY